MKLFRDYFLAIRDPRSFGRGLEDGVVAHEAPRCAQGVGRTLVACGAHVAPSNLTLPL